MATMSRAEGTGATITEAILTIVADRGLERATVREVAGVAGVSIGTVQHHFPTKDAMLAGAFTEVVRQVRERLDATDFGDDVRSNVSTVLREILPLDRRRKQEARVQLAFATRAMHEPALAATQRLVLAELHGALSDALASTGRHHPERTRLAAHAVLSLADGLALHALSTRRWLPARDMRGALDEVLEVLVPDDAGQVRRRK